MTLHKELEKLLLDLSVLHLKIQGDVDSEYWAGEMKPLLDKLALLAAQPTASATPRKCGHEHPLLNSECPECHSHAAPASPSEERVREAEEVVLNAAANWCENGGLQIHAASQLITAVRNLKMLRAQHDAESKK